MARKPEAGVSYYPLNTDHPQHPKIKLLINDTGATGYMVYQFILAEGYRKEGYFFNASDPDTLTLFALDVCKQSVEAVNAIIEACLRRKLFDRDLYEKHKILTSHRMQSNYLEATKRRKEPGRIRRSFVISMDHAKHGEIINDDTSPENVRNNSENVNMNIENVDRGTQSKVNKSKVNKSDNNIHVNINSDFATSGKRIITADLQPCQLEIEEMMTSMFPELSKTQIKKEAKSFFEYNFERGWKKGKGFIDLEETLTTWISRIHKSKNGRATIHDAITAGKSYKEFRKNNSK